MSHKWDAPFFGGAGNLAETKIENFVERALLATNSMLEYMNVKSVGVGALI